MYIRLKQHELLEKLIWPLVGFSVIGLAITLLDRIVEIPLFGWGSIKTVTEQALIDAGEIKKIKERVENQSATIDIIAMKSREIENLYTSLLEKNEQANNRMKEFELFLKDSQESLELSMDVLRKRIGVIDLHQQPLNTVECDTTLRINKEFDKSEEDQFPIESMQGSLVFSNEDKSIIWLTPEIVHKGKTADSKLVYRTTFKMKEPAEKFNISLISDQFLSPMKISDLKYASTIRIKLAKISKGTQILSGESICSINSLVRLPFPISEQIIGESGQIFIRDLQSIFNLLK